MTHSSSGVEILLIPIVLVAILVIGAMGAMSGHSPAVVSYETANTSNAANTVSIAEPAAPISEEIDEIILALTALEVEIVEAGGTWAQDAHDLPSVPVEAIPMLPLSKHARFDHPERISAEKIIGAWRLGQCHPKRVYFGCDGGTTQIAACRVAGIWLVLTVGLRSPVTIISRIEITDKNLERAARTHGCSTPVEYP